MDSRRWPALEVTDEWIALVEQALARNKARGEDPGTHADLARALSVSESTISRILRQGRYHEHKLVTPISRALDIPTTREMAFDDDSPANELAKLMLRLERVSPEHYRTVVDEVRPLVESLERWQRKND